MNEIPDLYGRKVLRSNWEHLGSSDQEQGVDMPDAHKSATDGSRSTPLPGPPFDGLSDVSLVDAMLNRRSRRSYADRPLSLREVGFLLYMTQGIQSQSARRSRRPVPSAGARHAFESYISVLNVEGLASGLYRYDAPGHSVLEIESPDDLGDATRAALLGQGWGAPIVFLWTAIPYRMEWRYQAASHKLIALDAGHLCQNLYLAAEAIGCGTCAIGAYDQELCDRLLGVDGSDELTVYAAPVGKLE